MTTNPYLPDHNYEDDSAAVQLRIVREAISRIEAGVQAYRTPHGDTYTRADLATLYRRERELAAKVAAESGSSRINLAQMRHRV